MWSGIYIYTHSKHCIYTIAYCTNSSVITRARSVRKSPRLRLPVNISSSLTAGFAQPLPIEKPVPNFESEHGYLGQLMSCCASLPFSSNVCFSHLHLTSSQLGHSKWRGEFCRNINKRSMYDKIWQDWNGLPKYLLHQVRSWQSGAVPSQGSDIHHDFGQYNTGPLSLGKP